MLFVKDKKTGKTSEMWGGYAHSCPIFYTAEDFEDGKYEERQTREKHLRNSRRSLHLSLAEDGEAGIKVEYTASLCGNENPVKGGITLPK